MNIKSFSLLSVNVIALAVFFSHTALAENATASPTLAVATLGDALIHGTPTLDMRYRYEFADQVGLAHYAKASTVRTRVGYTTGVYEGFKAGVELENISRIGAEHYNDGVNGKAFYPIVADDNYNTNLNQLYISYQGLPKTSMMLGRQLINLDNQRFVGTVEWRQNNQTFDAFSISSDYFEHAKLYYAYLAKVNRVFGENSTVGNFKGDSQIINASYEFDPALKTVGYTYLLGFDNAHASSLATYGVRLTGKHALNETVNFVYSAEGAHQADYANNPANISKNYYLLEPAISAYGWTGKLGYEVLQGDGTTAFQTPLATLHTFNGWADKFLTTPVNGLKDRYISVGYKVPFGNTWVKGTDGTVVYHDFQSEHGSTDYGTEWDASATQTFLTHYTIGLKYADYNADNFATDTTKIMVQLQIKL